MPFSHSNLSIINPRLLYPSVGYSQNKLEHTRLKHCRTAWLVWSEGSTRKFFYLLSLLCVVGQLVNRAVLFSSSMSRICCHISDAHALTRNFLLLSKRTFVIDPALYACINMFNDKKVSRLKKFWNKFHATLLFHSFHCLVFL